MPELKRVLNEVLKSKVLFIQSILGTKNGDEAAYSV